MITRLISASLRRRALVIVLALGVLAVSILQLDEVEVDTLPEFLPPIVEVQTEALGLSASEVEQLITVPLEADLLNGVAWLESIQSESVPGLSSVVMTFEPGTDLLEARQVVQERLTQAAGLPNVSRAPAMVQPLSSESRVMIIGLSSDELSLIDMSVLARWTIRPFLMGVTGVANVSVWGQRERQLQVHVDQMELEAENLALLDIVKTTGNALWTSPLSFVEASTPGTGGFLDGPNQRIGIQHVLGIEAADDLAAVTIEGHEHLTLGDVTEVVEDHQPLIGDAVVDGGTGLLLVVERFPWSSTVETTEAVEQALEELAPGLEGIDVDTSLFRPADYLGRSVDNAQLVTIISFIVLAMAAFALIAGWRGAVVGLFSLLVSLGAAGLVLLVADTEVNAMVFTGLVVALAFVVDDSLGEAEGVRRSLRASNDAGATGSIVGSVGRTRRVAIYGAVALTTAMVPTLVMEGSAGEFLPDIGAAMVLAVVVSIVVSLTVTPALSATLLVGHAGSGGSWLLKTFGGAMARLRKPFSRSVLPALLVSLGLVIVGLAMVPTFERQYVPDFEQTDVLIRLEGVQGTSLQASRRIAGSAADEIAALEGVEAVGAHIGRAVLSDEIVNVNSSELWVKIDPDADYVATIDEIHEVVTGYPGYGVPGAVSYSNERVQVVLEQPTQDLVVRVYGEDPLVLGELAGDVAALVDGIDGTENVRALYPLLEPGVEIEVDLVRAAEHGVKPGDVRRTAATLLSGIEVGSFFEEQKVFEVVVWSPPENRQSVTSVEKLLIDTPSGEVVELASVAHVRVAPAQNVIEREAVSRYIDVVADVSGRSAAAVESDIEEAIQVRGLPFEYHVRVLDDRADADANQRQVLAVAGASLVGILLVLQAAFSSWRLAAILMLAPPLALSGGLVALAISGGTYSIGSSVGLFAIWALTLRHSLAMIDEFDALQLDAGRELGAELVVAGFGRRMAPTVVTLVAIGVAMVPVVAFGTTAGLEVVRPAAIVLVGGVISSAIVSLLIVPAIYQRFAKPAEPHELLSGGPAGEGSQG